MVYSGGKLLLEGVERALLGRRVGLVNEFGRRDRGEGAVVWR